MKVSLRSLAFSTKLNPAYPSSCAIFFEFGHSPYPGSRRWQDGNRRREKKTYFVPRNLLLVHFPKTNPLSLYNTFSASFSFHHRNRQERKMKLSLACVLLTAATAIANPTPPQRGGRPKKPLEPGWEYSEDTRDHYGARIPIQPVNPQPMIREPSSCIAKCLSSEFRVAGCGHEKDWDCLCRYDGLAPEIQRCVNQNCHSELDL